MQHAPGESEHSQFKLQLVAPTVLGSVCCTDPGDDVRLISTKAKLVAERKGGGVAEGMAVSFGVCVEEVGPSPSLHHPMAAHLD
jgi:hypothetical protein